MRKSGKAKRTLRKLDYVPRWVWYLLSLSIGGPIGPLVVYLVFHALTKAAQDETENEESEFEWDVNVDKNGVHVRRGRAAQSSTSFGGANDYEDADCIVTGDEDVSRAWDRTEASARTAKKSTPVQEETTGGDEVADVIREGRAAMRRIRHANDLIPDPELSAQIDAIESSCGQILSILEQRPQLLTQLRTFLRYYLPTTLKLLEARAKLENTANTPKAREVRARISEAVGVIDKAFAKQVEALDEYRFIDLESEMDVLRDMLKSDGLVEEEKKADPFADVLAARAAQKHTGDTPMAGH